ncbi:MAG: hypothetical protein FK731_00560, partial [Asgard group archaeon]|nr:hypothetical protein [Asgard group archaeon]
MKRIKSKIIVSFILLIIILPSVLSKATVCYFDEKIESKNRDYDLNNIIYLYETYYNILLDDSLIYLMGYQEIEIFDINDPYKMVKIKEINGEPILDFLRLYHMFYKIDFN